MAISSIGSKPTTDVPAAPAEVEEKGQEAAREADAKKNTQRTERKLADGEKAISNGAAGKGISTLAVKDLLAASDSTALLEALLQAPVTQAAEQPKGDTAYETLAKLKELLGKPNGLPVPDKAFDHAELAGAAAFPGLLSDEGQAQLATILNPENAAQTAQLVEGMLSTTGIAARAGEIQVKGETTKATKEYVQKLQALAEKFLNAAAQQVPAPNLPAAVQKIFAANFPEISKAVKDFMKSAKPKDDDEIVIPDFAVLAFEEAIKPTVEAFTQVTTETAQAQTAVDAAPTSAQTSAAMSALLDKIKMVKADDGKPTRSLTWVGAHSELLKTLQPDTTSKGPALGPAKIIHAALPGMSVADADLESLIYFVMMQSTSLEGEILTDKLKAMQETNNQKKAQREKITHMKKEKADAEAAERKEFEYLQAQGAISPKTSFDEYQAWRQITWTPEGDAMLQNPMPPLPDSLIFGPDGPPQGPPGPGAVGDPDYPCNVDANKLAEQYGLSPEDIAYLNSYYQWVQANGSANLGIDPGGVGTFEEFLANTVGITDAGKGRANRNACKAFFDNTVTGDTATTAATGDGSLTQARFDELAGMTKAEIEPLLIAALSSPPLCDDPTIQSILAGAGGDWSKLFAPGKNAADSASKALQIIMLIDKVKELAPNSEALACLAFRLKGRSYAPSLTDIATSAGADPKSVWGGGAAPTSVDTYQSYKDHEVTPDFQAWCKEKGIGEGMGLAMYDTYVFDRFYEMITTEEPFKTACADLLNKIKNMVKSNVDDEYGLREALYSFMVGPNDADMDNGDPFTPLAVELMALLDSIAPGSTACAQFMALEGYCEDPDFWTTEGQQDAKFENQYQYFEDAQKAADEAAKAKEEADKADGEEGGETPAWGTTFADKHDAAVAEDAEAQAQREEARRKCDEARAAAKEGVAQLQTGTGLEGEKGAQTGSMAQFDAMVEGEQNEMDSLSDLSQTQSIALNQALDHRQKLLEALTNIMKKLSNTSDAIIQNTK